ncbi:hypothetical protein Hanom_Chr15g01366151 [Helianthus anomalus]
MKMAKSYKCWGQFGTKVSFWMKMANMPKPQGRFWQLTQKIISECSPKKF